MVVRKNIYKVLLVVAIVTIFIALVQYFHLRNYLSIEGFNRYRNDIMFFENNHPNMFVIGYVALYVLIIACCIPGTIFFDLLAGFVFGIYWGSILVIVSYLSGACVNFLIVRLFFKGALEHRFSKFKHFIHGNSRYGLLLNLIGLRLIAVIPFWVLNIVAALLNVRMGTFIISTAIGITPMSVIYVIIGDGVRDSVSNGHQLTADIVLNPKIWIPLFCMAILLMLPNIIKLIRMKGKGSPPKDG